MTHLDQKKTRKGLMCAVGETVMRNLGAQLEEVPGTDYRSQLAGLRRWTTGIVNEAAGDPSRAKSLLGEYGIICTCESQPTVFETPEKLDKNWARKPEISDEELRELLRPHCRESTLPARRVSEDANMLILTDSLRNIHETDPAIKGRLSYDYLTHRVSPHCPLIGIGRARIDSDLCSTCCVWDRSLQPEGTTMTRELRAEMTKLDPDFFASFDERCKARGWVASGNKCSVDNLEFLDAFTSCFEDVDGDARLGITAGCCANRLKKFRSEAAEIIPHWQRRNLTYKTLQRDLKCQEDYHTFGWCDWMEPPTQ